MSKIVEFPAGVTQIGDVRAIAGRATITDSRITEFIDAGCLVIGDIDSDEAVAGRVTTLEGTMDTVTAMLDPILNAEVQSSPVTITFDAVTPGNVATMSIANGLVTAYTTVAET